jgi:hypothetical protein
MIRQVDKAGGTWLAYPPSVNAVSRFGATTYRRLEASFMPGRAALARALPLALAIAASTGRLGAQAVLGPFEDATTAPRGTLRIGTGVAFTHFAERFDPSGGTGPTYGLFGADTVGVRQLPQLFGAQTAIATLTGDPTFRLSLGQLAVRSRARSTSIPLVLEAGITRRLTVGVVAPYVRTYNTVVGSIGPDPGQANVGFNPALDPESAARAANNGVYTQLEVARTQLAALIATCTATPGAAGCAPLNASPEVARALVAQSAAFAAAFARTYGLDTGAVSPLIPSVGSAAERALVARLAGFDSLYQALLGRSTSLITADPFSAVPVALGGVQRALGDSALGIVSGPLNSTRRSHFGDLEVDAKLLLLDSFGRAPTARLSPPSGSFNYRVAVGATVRLGTGQVDDPDDPTDLATGEGQTDVGARVVTDLLFGRRAWTSVAVRYDRQLADEPTLRVASEATVLFAPLYTRQRVRRDLGDLLRVEATPRVAVTQNFAVGGHYELRRKARDTFEGTYAVDSATTGYGAIELDADALLGPNTGYRQHLVGVGATYSTLGDYFRGRTRLPIDVSYLHRRVVSSRGGFVPRAASDEVSVRLYFRLFGAAPPRPTTPSGPPTSVPAATPPARPRPR